VRGPPIIIIYTHGGENKNLQKRKKGEDAQARQLGWTSDVSSSTEGRRKFYKHYRRKGKDGLKGGGLDPDGDPHDDKPTDAKRKGGKTYRGHTSCAIVYEKAREEIPCTRSKRDRYSKRGENSALYP